MSNPKKHSGINRNRAKAIAAEDVGESKDATVKSRFSRFNSSKPVQAAPSKSGGETKTQHKKGTAQQRLIDFIKHQTNIDLSAYRDTKFEKRGMLVVNWNKLSRAQRNEIMTLRHSYGGNNFNMSQIGSWAMAFGETKN